MITVRSVAADIVLTILAGFFSGVLIAMPPVCFVPLIKDKTKIGTRVGMGFCIIAFGLLASGPASGAILGTSEPLNWTALWVFGGVTACVGGLVYGGIRISRSGFKLNVKG